MKARLLIVFLLLWVALGTVGAAGAVETWPVYLPLVQGGAARPTLPPDCGFPADSTVHIWTCIDGTPVPWEVSNGSD